MWSFRGLHTSIRSSAIKTLFDREPTLIIISNQPVGLRFIKRTIDRSKVPVLDEKDLEESFINGSGPGGQNVNKRINCVFLKHTPSGLFVKCHESRSLESNRKQARKLLLTKLDNHLNGDQSVAAQKKQIDLELKTKNEEAARLKREQKAKLKEHIKNLKENKHGEEEQIEGADSQKQIELIKQLDRLDKLSQSKPE